MVLQDKPVWKTWAVCSVHFYSGWKYFRMDFFLKEPKFVWLLYKNNSPAALLMFFWQRSCWRIPYSIACRYHRGDIIITSHYDFKTSRVGKLKRLKTHYKHYTTALSGLNSLSELYVWCLWFKFDNTTSSGKRDRWNEVWYVSVTHTV